MTRQRHFAPLPTAPARRRADRARQVADALRPALVSRPSGSLLPAENDLAADFAVSRNTVREALDLLRREGLIERIPGVGTVVTSAKYEHSIDTLVGLTETVAGEVRNVVREAGTITVPESVAGRLGLGAGDPVVYVERLRLVDGEPLSLNRTYLVADIGEGVLTADLAGRDVVDLIEETAGKRLGGASVAIEASSADAAVATLLGVPIGAPLLMVERLTRLEDGRPVHLELVRFRGDRMALRGTLQRIHPPLVLSSGTQPEGVPA